MGSLIDNDISLRYSNSLVDLDLEKFGKTRSSRFGYLRYCSETLILVCEEIQNIFCLWDQTFLQSGNKKWVNKEVNNLKKINTWYKYLLNKKNLLFDIWN